MKKLRFSKIKNDKVKKEIDRFYKYLCSICNYTNKKIYVDFLNSSPETPTKILLRAFGKENYSHSF